VKKLATKQIASVEVMYLFKWRRIFDRWSWVWNFLFQLCSSASSTFLRNGAYKCFQTVCACSNQISKGPH
jgi:hypothetical protein